MKEFQTDSIIVRIHDNLLKEVIVKKNKTLRANDVLESKQLSSEYKPMTKFFVLIEGEDNASVSAEARAAVASKEYSEHTVALALCSNNSYQAIVGNLFLKINKPSVPTRFFEDRKDAITWLQSQMPSS